MNRIHTNTTRQTFTVPVGVFRKFAAAVPSGQCNSVVTKLLDAETRRREKALTGACLAVNEQTEARKVESEFGVLEDTVGEPSDLAVIVSADEWERKSKRTGNLAEFFANSPLRGTKLKVTRIKGGARKINL